MPSAETINPVRRSNGSRPKVLILTSSLLTDRMLLYSGCLEKLNENCHVRVWATSARNKESSPWTASPAEVQEFPSVCEFKEFPYNFARRLNDFTWDSRLRPP